MAVKHTTPADGTFSASGAVAWDADHNIEAGTVTPTELDRAYTVPADLLPYQVSSTISSAAFRDVSFFAQSSVISSASFRDEAYFSVSSAIPLHLAAADPHPQYQLSSLVSSAAFRLDTYFVNSSQISTAAYRASSFFVNSSAISSAAFRLDTYFVASSVISTAAYRASSFFAQSTAIASAAFRDEGFFVASSTISSAAFRLETYFVTSSMISTAAFRASSFFAQSSVISSAAFQASTAFAISTHALSHITGGDDLIPSFNATSSGVAPLSGGGTANFLRADGAWVAPGGGSDPWTYLTVSSQHYGTSNVPFADVTGLRFTPGTNSTYEWEFQLLVATSTAAVTPRIGVRWPTGTSSVGWINQGQTNSTQLFTWGNQLSTMQVPAVGLLATTTAPWGVIGGGVIRALGGAASSFAVQHATESTTVFTSTMIGSYLKYRTLP